ncbi:hypothetical protein DID88_002752 [Monilinia fructigena]|uniref:DNA-directed RNA polymerase subunit n=1 Tax=Monilinia fructigena TaxID=38457 RepID=A0A395IP86_9HELO|nr:hypothetical protein DID88_002752 [Monilinia fructigena]
MFILTKIADLVQIAPQDLGKDASLIGHGDGLVNVNVEFRIVVFRPFKFEIMTGRISSSIESGIRVRTSFLR